MPECVETVPDVCASRRRGRYASGALAGRDSLAEKKTATRRHTILGADHIHQVLIKMVHKWGAVNDALYAFNRW